MASRIRSSPHHVFDCFMEICKPGTGPGSKPYILQKYPHTFKDEEIIKSVAQFCYPCSIESPNVLHFSFVLTSIDSKWSFGFIRHPPQPGETCLLLLSSLPWHDTFYKLLNYIASLIAKDDAAHLNRFLEALYLSPVPQPGLFLQIIYAVNNREYEFTAQCPDHHKIPSIPEDRNLSEYFNAVDSNNMIMIFASMLNERRILITSNKLSRLSACVQAANSLIYPMYWQHIFIPVLPSHLLDYLSAPMPFLIGVPSSTLATVKQAEFGEIVILDSDENKIISPFDDVGMLPNEIVSFLKKSLRNNGSLIGDGVARTFLKALVMLIGGYQNALRFPSGGKITFDKEAFVKTRPEHMQPFLQKMLHLQIFHQFIEDRIKMLTNAESISDEFEFEVNMYEEEQSSHRFRTQYREWLGQMKKEGGALLKSVNPAVKSAYKQVKHRGKQVKDRSKKAYHGLRLKLQDIQKPEQGGGLPRSAPSSPRESPTSSSYRLQDGTKSHVKKSASGMVFGKQGKSQMFMMTSEDLATKRSMFNDNTRRNPFYKDENNSNDQAPEASSEDSEVDSLNDDEDDDDDDDGLPEIEDIHYEPINIDLMGELQEVIKGYGLRCSLEETSLPSNHVQPSIQSKNEPFNLPLPPPRAISSRSNSKDNSSAKEDLLITLDSSPEDLEAIFDPLKQKKRKDSYESNVSLSNQPTMSSSSSANVTPSRYGVANQGSVESAKRHGLHQFPSNIQSNLITPATSMQRTPFSLPPASAISATKMTPGATELNGFIGNHSFLHSFHNNIPNGALRSSLPQPTRTTTIPNTIENPATRINSLSTTNPFSSNHEYPVNYSSCGKSSGNISYLHQNRDNTFINSENNTPFQSNWQKFE